MTYSILNTVPALPAKVFKETLQFYKDLGFVNEYENQKRSRGYAVLTFSGITFHLFAYKKLEVPTAANIILVNIKGVDALYQAFQERYQESTGKPLKRSGLPRISMPRDLNADRRFSLADPNGNYFYFIEEYEKREDQSETFLEKLYRESNTLAYSHESPIEAVKMMQKGLKKSNLALEKPEAVFEAYVLLADMYFLLENMDRARENLETAEAWHVQLEEKEQGDSLKYFWELKKKLK